MKRHISKVIFLMILLCTACVEKDSEETVVATRPWNEQEITFAFGDDELFGIVTLPSSPGPHPAIVFISGSADIDTGTRSGSSSTYFSDHAHRLAEEGFASLRYDPPGVGRSTGAVGFESLDFRAEEAIAALEAVRSREDIVPGMVGLWGGSQGGWVVAMAAAAHPEEVAFIISVSGSGVPVAEQQVYSIEAQSRAANFSEEDITKAVLFGRTLIDWQLSEPIYQELNLAGTQALGEGPWVDFVELVYDPGDSTPAESLQEGIDILKLVKDEPWARFLYLEELYIPQLESIPPEQVDALRSVVGQTLLNDPSEYLSKVQCPVLAIFGENDLLQPSEKSAELYKQYLDEAGNTEYEIVIIPGVGHHIGASTPGYWEALSGWLKELPS